MVLVDFVWIGLLRPDEVFILLYRRVLGWFYRSVTVITRARLDPQVLGAAVLGLGVGLAYDRKRRDDESGDSDRM